MWNEKLREGKWSRMSAETEQMPSAERPLSVRRDASGEFSQPNHPVPAIKERGRAEECKHQPKLVWRSPLLQRRVAENFAFQNTALRHASQIIRSESARLNGSLMSDFAALLGGNAVYIPEFICEAADHSLYQQLKNELIEATGAGTSGEGGLIEWSQHQVFENPSNLSKTFNDIVDMLEEYFDLDVYATRLNYYRDGTQWKPQHHDSHAYGGRAEREDFTAGITLGSDRNLVFVHVDSKEEFSFPQHNGDCFAFTNTVNQAFTHGVPRATRAAQIGDRLSIITWGRRKTINERNGGGLHSAAALRSIDENGPLETVDQAIAAAQTLVSSSKIGGNKGNIETKKKKKNRLQ